MADLIIRGMGNIPVGQEFVIVENIDFERYLYNRETGAAFHLVPLPEGHGDLVERKALNLFPDYKDVRNRIKQTIKATERDGRNITGVTIDLLKQTLVALDSLRSVRRYFLNAKTIVPAEGGGEDGDAGQTHR